MTISHEEESYIAPDSFVTVDGKRVVKGDMSDEKFLSYVKAAGEGKGGEFEIKDSERAVPGTGRKLMEQHRSDKLLPVASTEERPKEGATAPAKPEGRYSKTTYVYDSETKKYVPRPEIDATDAYRQEVNAPREIDATDAYREEVNAPREVDITKSYNRAVKGQNKGGGGNVSRGVRGMVEGMVKGATPDLAGGVPLNTESGPDAGALPASDGGVSLPAPAVGGGDGGVNIFTPNPMASGPMVGDAGVVPSDGGVSFPTDAAGGVTIPTGAPTPVPTGSVAGGVPVLPPQPAEPAVPGLNVSVPPGQIPGQLSSQPTQAPVPGGLPVAEPGGPGLVPSKVKVKAAMSGTVPGARGGPGMAPAQPQVGEIEALAKERGKLMEQSNAEAAAEIYRVQADEGKRRKAEMEAMERVQSEMRELRAKYDESDAQFASLRNQTINPGRFWQNQNGFQKAMAVLAGAAFGYTGQGMQWLQRLDSLVSEDVKMQQADFENARQGARDVRAALDSRYAQLRQAGLDQQQAAAAARAAAMDDLNLSLKRIAAGPTSSQAATMGLQMAARELDQKAGLERQQVAQGWAKLQLDKESMEARKLSEAYEFELAMQKAQNEGNKPNAAMARVMTPLADAMQLRKQLGAIKSIIANPNDDKAKAAIDSFARRFGITGAGARQRTVDFLWRRILVNWDKSALQQGDVKFYENVTPRVGDFQTAEQFNSLLGMTDDMISTEMWKLRQAGIPVRSLKTGQEITAPSDIEDVFDEGFGRTPEGFSDE